MKSEKSPKVFFGWWTVLVTCLLSIWGYGYFSVGFSALFKPISAELGLGRAVTSAARSLGQFQGGIEALVVGGLSDRFGPRVVILFGIVIASIGLMLMYFVNALWSFYLIWGIIVAIGMNTSLTVPAEKAISNWFVKKRGTALSFRWISVVLSTILIVPLISIMIPSVGWRMTCVIGGVVMLVFGLPLAWFFIRKERPEYYGLLPDGAAPEKEPSADKSQMVSKGVEYAARFQEVEFTLRQTIRTYSFWLLIAGYITYQTTITVIFTHCIPFLTDMGISAVMAAGVMAIAGAIGIPFRFGTGFITDRLRKEHLRFLMGVAFLIMSGGIFAFLQSQTMSMVYVLLILFYIGQGAGIILFSVVRARYFGRKSFGSIQGTAQMIMMPFVVAAPIYAGWVFDTTGSYLGAFRLFAGLLILGTVLVFLARPPKPPVEITDVSKLF